MNSYGEPPFPYLQYCKRCCMPETNEGIKFDEKGICQSCQSMEQKMHIDWDEREKMLRKFLEEAKSNAKGPYDCVVGMGGGKDSTWLLHVLTKIYDVNPLAVTFSHRWYTDTGLRNIQNAIEKFNIDHIMFTPRRDVINKVAKKSLSAIGDACWHCHAGSGATVLRIAIQNKVPLIIWGESVAEESGRANHLNRIEYDRDYFLNTSAKVTADKMVGEGVSLKELAPYVLPSQEDYDQVNVKGIFIGDYLFWDAERQTEFVRDVYGWEENYVEGTYKNYKSVECVMSGVHDYAKYIKRGFGRATDHVSQDVQAGLLTREEGFELIKKYDPERPSRGLDYYLKLTGFTEEEFHEILKTKREGKAKNLP